MDKLCLNNIIQDNTYMKDYLCYQMMADMGVASPLCSYVYITVNGEDWGFISRWKVLKNPFCNEITEATTANSISPTDKTWAADAAKVKTLIWINSSVISRTRIIPIV